MSSIAADWIGVNFSNLTVNVIRLLGDESVRRWFRYEDERIPRWVGGAELDEVRRSMSRINERLVRPPSPPTVVTDSPVVIVLPIFIFVPAHLPQTSSSLFPLPQSW